MARMAAKINMRGESFQERVEAPYGRTRDFFGLGASEL
jgi:hypothetical protein